MTQDLRCWFWAPIRAGGSFEGKVAGGKLNGGVALAVGFEQTEPGHAPGGDVREGDLGVEAQATLEVLWLKGLPSEFIESGAEGVHVLGAEGEAGGGGMAAVAEEEVGAMAQGGSQVEAGDAPARSLATPPRHRRR